MSLDGEVLDGKMFFPVVGPAFVKVAILLLGNVGVTGPDRLRLVKFLHYLLDFLLLNVFL